MEKITSIQNPKIKQVIKLRNAKERKKKQLFLVEGKKEILMAIGAGYKIENIFINSKIKTSSFLINFENKKQLFVDEKIFKKISYRENPDGFLAIFKIYEKKLKDIKLSQNPLIIILEALEKPGNIGAILRSADAAKADAIIVCDAKTDLFNPNIIRASLGAVFYQNIITLSKEKILTWLKENNINIYAASVSASTFYFENDLSKPLAVVIGNEHNGLSKFWLNNCDKQIKIPMLGKIDSLNASVSLAVIIFESLRQRMLKLV